MRKKADIEIKNKKAGFNYELIDRYTAGLVLLGTEIKSIREGKAGLVDSYCAFHNGELWVVNMHIAAFRLGNFYNHEAQRQRKLLLNRRELKKLERATKETGFTIVPTKLFIDSKGLAKLEISVARGKKLYNKREAIKEKDIRREMERNE
ncbi:MAG: SsrA-binding protein SmpB [Prevotellaceae bacterium]|jgi:SsrA-binding protein|nr:SsrA-binding protein SmpB [Prevotellaceae bacterium]